MVQAKTAIAIVLLIAVIGGIFLFSAISQNPIKTAGVINNPDESPQNSQEISKIFENIIEITSSGFSPETLEVKRGATVTWTNKDETGAEHRPASAVHPTHTLYPGSDIEKCGTSGQEGIFDSCRGLAQGESWSFTFNEVGTWSYHDHLDAGLRGKVIVTEEK